jgi:membrane protein implicated in regulation of membrane protease activity
MPSWLLILIVGVILMIVGFSGVGSLLVWIGVAVLVVSLILGLLGRGRSRA